MLPTKYMWAINVFTLELRKYFTYRVDFWVNFLGRLFSVTVVSYFLWKSIFQYRAVTQIGGYSFSAMILYYLFSPITEKVIIGNEKDNGISFEIYDGSLSCYLMYPISFFLYKYVIKLAQSSFMVVQYFIALGGYLLFFQIPQDVSLSLLGLIQSIVLALIASFVYFTLLSLIELSAFWADNIWSLCVMLRFSTSMLGGILIPLTLFPNRIQNIIFYTPFPYFGFIPIQLAMGKLSHALLLEGIVCLFIWELVFLFLFYLVWLKGLKKYTGVGI
ncbi:MAG: ABC-2 family transporter protein [Deltaproteobacteria bacterium]|nr:ABC-2 family transporter protein [Deltaproteobacteria bacterium]